MILKLDGLTMNAEEATQVSQAIFERVITGGELEKTHDIVTGIAHKTQIPFIGAMGLLGKKVTSCARTASTSQMPLTEKFWDPTLIGDRLAHCSVEVPMLLKLFGNAKRVNPDFYDRIGSEEMGVIVARVEQAMESMLNRLIWFGDKNAANVSGSGVIKNGTDVDFFNPIDGLWKQIMVDVPVTAPNYVSIAKNAGASYSAQALAPDSALGIFRAMYNKMDSRFFQAMQDGAQPELLVTRELFQNYQDQLEDKSLVFSTVETKDGVTGLSYRGIPIVVRYDWDNMIRAYQDNGTKFNLPNRALLTVKENIPVGTLATEDLDHVESFYDQKDKTNYIDIDLMLDVKHLLSYLTVAAY